MDFFQRHELRRVSLDSNEYELVIHLDTAITEFADELGTKPRTKDNLRNAAIQLINKNYPGVKVTVVKVMVGGMIVSSLPLFSNPSSSSAQSNASTSTSQTTETSAIYYHVSAGDTLWILAKKYDTTVDHIKRGNNLGSDTLQLNQRLIIPKAFHTVKAGDNLSTLAKNYQTSVAVLKEANNLTSDTIRLGQILTIPVLAKEQVSTPIQNTTPASEDPIVPEPAPPQPSSMYTVVAGDNLWKIAQQFGTTVDALRSTNNLKSDNLQIGQTLTLPTSGAQPAAPPSTDPESEPPKSDLSQPSSPYTVVAGDNLWKIAQQFGTTVDALRSTNNLKSDNLQIEQTLTLPTSGAQPAAPPPTDPESEPEAKPDLSQPSTTYTVVAGDNLWKIAQQYGTTVDALRSANNLKSDNLQIGQTLMIPSKSSNEVKQPIKEERVTFTYRVIAGDSLSVIANRFGVTVDSIRSANNLNSNVLQIGQALVIQNGMNAPTQTSANSISYITHKVVSGDNIWALSVRYGIPQTELMRANNLTSSSMLQIGQQLTIPVHHIAVKQTVSEKHGELLDWWTEAQYVFSIGKTAKVTDLVTGKSFTIKRTIGANHADSETISVKDTEIAKSIWGGFSWTPRAVIVEVDGRKLAASMSFMPHDVEYIANNGITGHFDVYFSNSTRHIDGRSDASHQLQVERAAGLR